MPESEWELLTVRGLGMTDESASEFVGTFVIHRTGSQEPVENIRRDLCPLLDETKVG